MPNIHLCSLPSRSSTPTISFAERVKLVVELLDRATQHFKFVVDPGEMLVNAVDPPVNAVHASANAAEASINGVESAVNLCAGKDLDAFFLADHAGTIALPQSSLPEDRPLHRVPFRPPTQKPLPNAPPMQGGRRF